MRVRYNALARADVVDILKYYEHEAGHRTAVDFFAELTQAIKRIAAAPSAFEEIAARHQTLPNQTISVSDKSRDC